MHQCDRPLVVIDGHVASCGHCGVVVYPDILVLADHDLSCDNEGICTWYSRAMAVVVHRCDGVTIDDIKVREAEIIDLLEGSQ